MQESQHSLPGIVIVCLGKDDGAILSYNPRLEAILLNRDFLRRFGSLRQLGSGSSEILDILEPFPEGSFSRSSERLISGQRFAAIDYLLCLQGGRRAVARLLYELDGGRGYPLGSNGERAGGHPAFDEIVGSSSVIEQARRLAMRAARTELAVLLSGETGTGKELFARAIAGAGKRAARPFVAVNCAAIPESLLESELFGYSPGAFTGALRNGKPGYFETADGGTLFLDEIGDLPSSMQAKLLRVLEQGQVQKVGAAAPVTVDVRVIAATNKDLGKVVDEGSLRADLYYRLNVVHIRVPPLRERREDIELLARTFAVRAVCSTGMPLRTLADEVVAVFRSYHWPGNVRELRNVVDYAASMADGNVVGMEHLPSQLVEGVRGTCQQLESSQLGGVLAELEKEVVIKSLQLTEGNKTQAARLLGMSRATLYQKLSQYGIRA